MQAPIAWPDKGVVTVTPVFSENVVHTLPKGFRPAHEANQGPAYLREAVLAGQTVHDWTQMVTLTGAKDAVAKSGMEPMQVAGFLAQGYMKNCQGSATKPVANGMVNGHPAFAAWVACGAVNGKDYGESALILVIKGIQDYYTLQWAERRPASKTTPAFDAALWLDRLKQLQPVKVCKPTPGEKAPYPSCLNAS